MTDKMQYVIGILISVVMAFAYLGLTATETETETQTKRQQALADPSVQQTFSAEASNRRSVGEAAPARNLQAPGAANDPVGAEIVLQKAISGDDQSKDRASSESRAPDQVGDSSASRRGDPPEASAVQRPDKPVAAPALLPGSPSS